MEWEAESLLGLEKEYEAKLKELRLQQEQLEKEFELRRKLFIAATSKVI